MVRAPSRPDTGWVDGWWGCARHMPSPNCEPRPQDAVVDLVILHSISLPPGRYGGTEIDQLFMNTLDCTTHPYYERLHGLHVSAHFVLRRGGEPTQFVSIHDRAWHAGASQWGGRENCNDFSIGIELEGLEGESFEPGQYDAVTRLLHAIDQVYPVRQVIGHEHVAPGRKFDPGPGFDWALLASRLGWDEERIPVAHREE